MPRPPPSRSLRTTWQARTDRLPRHSASSASPVTSPAKRTRCAMRNSSANATSASACTGSRRGEPAIVRCQSRSNSRASARSSTSWPLRGTSVPTERISQPGPPEPVQRGASSVPGTTTATRARSTPKSVTSRSAVGSLVTISRYRRPIQPLLHAAQRLALGFGEAGLQRGGMVDQADRAARRQRILHAGEGWQRQSIDHRPRRFGKPIPCRARRVARGIVGERKAPGEFHHVHRIAGARSSATMRRS